MNIVQVGLAVYFIGVVWGFGTKHGEYVAKRLFGE